MFELPASYETKNLYNGSLNPSTVHSKNTGLTKFFRRYLLQKTMSVFKFELPETWDTSYFLYTLFINGHIAILDTDDYGVIPQNCALSGYNVFYRPSRVLVSNPLIRGTQQRTIDIDCVVVKLEQDYGGIMDLINFYADQLGLCAESIGMNLINTRVATVFAAANKSQAESYKKLYDEIASGNPAVVIDKNLFNENGDITWKPFTADIKQQYIVTDILSDMRKIEAMFDTDIGIPNANTDKRERLITDEVNANNIETSTRCELWLETMRKDIEKANKMFGLSLQVGWRNDPANYTETVNSTSEGGEAYES